MEFSIELILGALGDTDYGYSLIRIDNFVAYLCEFFLFPFLSFVRLLSRTLFLAAKDSRYNDSASDKSVYQHLGKVVLLCRLTTQAL